MTTLTFERLHHSKRASASAAYRILAVLAGPLRGAHAPEDLRRAARERRVAQSVTGAMPKSAAGFTAAPARTSCSDRPASCSAPRNMRRRSAGDGLRPLK